MMFRFPKIMDILKQFSCKNEISLTGIAHCHVRSKLKPVVVIRTCDVKAVVHGKFCLGAIVKIYSQFIGISISGGECVDVFIPQPEFSLNIAKP